MAAGELIADAGRIHGATGQRHATVLVDDHERATVLEGGFAEAGWHRLGIDVLVGPAAAGSPPSGAVGELALDALQAVERELWATELGDRAAERLDDVVAALRATARTTGERRFAVHDDDRVVGYAKLRRHAGVAAIADLAVLPGHRGRGHGRALADAALRAALAATPELVYALVPAGGAARAVYDRLGFTEAGTVTLFRRIAQAR